MTAPAANTDDLVGLLAELVYALDAVIRYPELAQNYREMVAKNKAFILKYHPELAARLYD